MPTYDYRCSGGHRYEKREPFGSPAQQPCDRCGKTAKRVIHAPPIVFKGSGWYQTDHRSGSRRSSESSSSETSEKRREAEATTAERNAKAKSKSDSSSSSSSSSSGSDSHISSNGSKPE